MSKKQPRIPPLPESEWTDEARKVGTAGNVALTLARHPKLGVTYLKFGLRLLRESTLPDRLRETVTLRVAHLCRVEYEWTHHVRLGKKAGLTDEDIEAIKLGSGSPVWSELERYAIRGAEELLRDIKVSDETWSVLARYLDERQLLDFLFTVGGYTMLGMFMNSVGLQVE